MGSLATLVACGGGGGGGSTPPPAGTSSINLINASGVTVTADAAGLAAGISTACYYSNDDSAYIQETTSVVGTVASYAQKHYSDDTCTTLTATLSFKADVVVGQDLDITDWIDGMGDPLTTPPGKASDSSVALPVTPKYTKLDLTISETSYPGISINDTTVLGFVIDDSSTEGVVLYRVDENGNASDTDPYTNISASPSGGTGGATTGGPDIRISIDSVERTAYSDSKIAYTVTNYGDAATGSFQVMGWADRASAPDLGSAGSGKFNTHADLAANGGSEQGIVIVDSVTLTTGAALNAYVIADYYLEVGETDEGVTGTNDNLSHKAWTVQDIFVFGGASLIEQSPTTVISAIYDGTYTIIRMTTSGDTAVTLQAILTGEVVPGTYTTASGTIAQAYVTQSGATYMTSAVPANSAVSFNIAEGSLVGNVISGTYSAALCSNWSSFTNCSGTSKTFNGNFSMVRDPDV